MNIMLNEDIIMYLDPSQFSERVGKIFKGNVYEYIERLNGWYRLSNRFWVFKRNDHGDIIIFPTNRKTNEKFEYYKNKAPRNWLKSSADVDTEGVTTPGSDTSLENDLEYVKNSAGEIVDSAFNLWDSLGTRLAEDLDEAADYINRTAAGDFFNNHNRSSQNALVHSMRAMLCMPYQFLPLTDARLNVDENGHVSRGSSFIDEDTKIGRKYFERIANRAPMLVMAAGDPLFMAGSSDADKQSMIEKLVGEQTLVQSMDDYFADPPRYYSFRLNTASYFEYVNTMCLVTAVNMGLITAQGNGNAYGYKTGESCVPFDSGSNGISKNCYLGEHNWDEAFRMNKENQNEALKSIWGKNGMISAGFRGGVAFYINSESQISESISNGTAQSQIASKVNQISDLAREFQFLAGASSSASARILETVGSSVQGAMEQMKNLGDMLTGPGSLVSAVAGSMSNIIAGGKMIFPELWADSQFSREYQVNIKLTSPDNDDLSLYHNIIVPLMHLIAFALPRGSSTNSYVAPFLVRAAYKSFFKIDMGLITSMSITKGAEGCWNHHGIPTVVDVSFTIKELYGLMNLAKNDKIFSSTNSYNILKNEMLMDYLANLSGLNLVCSDVQRATLLNYYQTSTKFSVYNLMHEASDSGQESLFNTVTQSVSNFFKIKL